MNKIYNKMSGVGKTRYIVNFHDGEKKHDDGSDFFDIKTFSNKETMLEFINQLEHNGYIYQ